MNLHLLLPLAWRNLWRNPRRTIITVLVVGVGVWSILIFSVLLKAWGLSSRDATIRLMTGEVQIHAPGYLDDPTAARRMKPPAAGLLRALHAPAVKAYAPRVRISAIVKSEYKTLPVTLSGVDPAAERQLSTLPGQIASGRYLVGPDDNGIVLGRNLATRLKTRIGKRVVVMSQAADGHLAERAFRVVGLFAAARQAEDGFAFTGLTSAQSFVGIGRDVTEIALALKTEDALDATVASLKASSPGLDIRDWKSLEPMTYAVSTFFNSFIMLWLWVMFALMTFGIVNTQMMAVFERSREFGLLQALGMRPKAILGEVALETVLLVGVGVVLGIGAACACVAAFPEGIDLGFLGRGAEYVGAGKVLHPQIDIADFVFYGAIVWVLSTLVALWPARRAARINPVEAMSHS